MRGVHLIYSNCLYRAHLSSHPDHYLWKRVRLQGTRLLTIGKHNDGHVRIPIMILARCEIGPTCYPKRKRGITVRASVITPTARCKLSLNRMIIPAQASDWPRAGRTSRFSQIHDSPKAATCLIMDDFSPGRRFRSTPGRLRITSASHYHRSCELLFCHRSSAHGRSWCEESMSAVPASHLIPAQYYTAVNLSPTQSQSALLLFNIYRMDIKFRWVKKRHESEKAIENVAHEQI